MWALNDCHSFHCGGQAGSAMPAKIASAGTAPDIVLVVCPSDTIRIVIPASCSRLKNPASELGLNL